MNADDFWGEPIYRYTRADALRDGVLIDITNTASVCAQLQVPTAITHGLWHALAPREPFDPQDERLKTVLYGLLFASVGFISSQSFDTPGAQFMSYGIVIEGRELKVKAAAHLDERGQPVCSLMLISED